MGKKYFTLSFDDGLEQDKRVIQLMRQYGLKGTFNLNAGLLGTRGEVKGLGTFSFQDCPEGVKHKVCGNHGRTVDGEAEPSERGDRAGMWTGVQAGVRSGQFYPSDHDMRHGHPAFLQKNIR